MTMTTTTTTATHVWCSHCLKVSRAVLEANFISCSTCGKLLSEIKVKKASRLRKKNARRFKRTRKAMNFRPNSPNGSPAEEIEERFRTLGL